MPPVLSEITRVNNDGSVKSTDDLYEAGLDQDLAYIISNVVSNIKSNPLQTKRRQKEELNILVLFENVCYNQRAVQCDECNCWSHVACNGVSKLEYKKRVEEDNSVDWHCLAYFMMHAASFFFVMNQTQNCMNF